MKHRGRGCWSASALEVTAQPQMAPRSRAAATGIRAHKNAPDHTFGRVVIDRQCRRATPRGSLMAHRVQLLRMKGWRMPPNTRKVDRSTVFGNPFEAGSKDSREAVRLHRAWLSGGMTDGEIETRYPRLVATHLIARRRRVLASVPELRGMNLACWCPRLRACHADLLLELANRIEGACVSSSPAAQESQSIRH